mgnify:CR=1 FL=1
MVILYLILSSFLLSNINNYNISMWGIDVAKVSIESSNMSNNDGLIVQKISYESRTESLIDFFYSVSNYYETIISGNDILKYKKDINQRDYQEKFITYRRNDTTFYNSDKFICQNCHNIFSLLNFAQQNPYKAINNDFIIDRDGESFKANFTLKSQVENILTLQLNMDLVNNQNSIHRKNDIFLWALFLPNCERLISIDIKSNNIVKCQFTNKLASLEANLVK